MKNIRFFVTLQSYSVDDYQLTQMYMKRMTTFAAIGLLVLASCSKSKDLYDPNISSGDKPETEIKVEANTFDFSTTQSVNLAVDYSASKAGSVFFSIYAENPMTDDDDPALKENVLPVFEAFTDASGKFNSSVSLPAYAKHLYVYTGNFFVSDKLIECLSCCNPWCICDDPWCADG